MMFVGISAFASGRSFLIWGFLGYMIGWPALIIVALIGTNTNRLQDRLETFQQLVIRLNNFTEKQESKKNGYKEFNTVDDLFKQLQTK